MRETIYRQDAINALDKRFDSVPMELTSEILQLRKDLRTMPSAQPDAPTDLISRQALCEYALNQKDKSVTPNDIMRFPSAQPEPKIGKWNFIGDNMFACSSCGTQYTLRQLDNMRVRTTDPYFPNFCPHCGSFNMEVERG